MPLAGKRVLVTRASHQAEELAEPLRRAGAVPILAPAVRITPPADPAPLAEAVARLSGFQWVAFTSANGVERVRAALAGNAWPAAVKIAAVGRTTAETLRAAGLPVDLVPEAMERAEGLAEALGRLAPRARVLVPGPEEGREELAQALAAAGAEVTTVAAYRTVPATEADPALCARLEAGELFAATLASPSAARGLLAMARPALDRLFWLPIATVGPTTARAALGLGLRVVAVAERPSMEALVEALARFDP